MGRKKLHASAGERNAARRSRLREDGGAIVNVALDAADLDALRALQDRAGLRHASDAIRLALREAAGRATGGVKSHPSSAPVSPPR